MTWAAEHPFIVSSTMHISLALTVTPSCLYALAQVKVSEMKTGDPYPTESVECHSCPMGKGAMAVSLNPIVRGL